MTAYDAVAAALRYLGVYRIGQSIGADDGEVGLSTLNAMRGAWAADGIALHGTAILDGTTESTGRITFGTGGDVATRPVDFIEVIDRTDAAPCILYRRTWAEYEALGLDVGGPPSVWAWDAASPLSTLATWPRSANRSIRAVVESPLPAIAALSNTIPDPPEYDELTALGLAVRLAPQYAMPVPDTVAALFASRWQAVTMRNASRRIPRAVSELAGSVESPWQTDLVTGRFL